MKRTEVLLSFSILFCLSGLALIVLLAASAAPAQERIYIANDDHTDYVWSGTESDYERAFQDMLSYYLNQAESTAGNPVNERGRFTCDGTLWAYVWEHSQPASQMNRLMDHVRMGDITIPLTSLDTLPGAMTTEGALRDMYYAGRLERRFGVRFPLVIPMENQTLPAGIAGLWAGAGAKYAWKGICNCASQVDATNRPRDIYWFTAPDGSSVLMKWNTLVNGNNQSLGGYAEAYDPSGIVDFMSTNSSYRSRWPWAVKAAFGYGWDALETTVPDFIDVAHGMTNGSRTVISSNEIDFFQDFAANYGTQIPSFGGSFGNEWDLNVASLGEVNASMRREVERLRTAEALAAVSAPYDGALLTGRDAARDDAHLSMGLFYEHDWTADSSIGRQYREAFQRDRLSRVRTYTTSLNQAALSSLAGQVSNPGGERYVVFNPLSWSRSDFVDLPASPSGAFSVVNVGTGLEVPSQLLPGGGVRILGGGVPSVGYAVYEVRSGVGQAWPLSATVDGNTMDNGIYRITLAGNGAITSCIDHAAGGREMAKPGSALNLKSTPSGAITGTGTVVVEANGPVFTTLSVMAPGSPQHQARVTLYKNLDRIDVSNQIAQNFSNIIGYDFTFNLIGFTIRHEEVGMIAKVARMSAGGDYADQNARTDYLTLNHFVDLSESGYGITLSSADSAFMKVGSSTVTSLDSTRPRVFAVVGGQINPGYGITNQGGDSSFLNRFSMQAHGSYDAPSAMRFALEHQNPLIPSRLTGGAAGALPPDQYRALTITSPDILAWAVKPSEEGIDQGLIVRVWNLAESSRSLDLSLAQGITSARTCTHIETDLGPAQLSSDGHLVDTLARQQLKTYRLFLPSLPPSLAMYFDTVQKVYIGYYQRPADPEGLVYWAGRLNTSGGNLTEIIEAFANSPESQALYGTVTDSNISTVVNGIYQALFGRDAEPGGLSFYVDGFNTGQFTPATIMLNVLYGAQNTDLQSVNNKLASANLFSRTIDPELDGANFQVTYAGVGDVISARTFLASVTGDTGTVPAQDETTTYLKSNIADPGDPILNP